MPRKIRWYPIPHDFTRSPEVEELKKKYGNDFIYVLLDLMSQCHSNNGLLKGKRAGIISFCSRSWSKKIENKSFCSRLLSSFIRNGWFYWSKEGLNLDKSLLNIHRREHLKSPEGNE